MIAEWFAKQVIHHSWTNVGKIFYFICVFLFCLFLSELPLAHSNTWSVPAHRFNTSNDWKWLIGVYWKRKNSKTPRQSLPFQHKYIFIISGRNTCTAITTIHCHCPMLPEIDPYHAAVQISPRYWVAFLLICPFVIRNLSSFIFHIMFVVFVSYCALRSGFLFQAQCRVLCRFLYRFSRHTYAG